MVATVDKSKYREYPAKPALLRRRDVSLQVYESTMCAVGAPMPVRDMLALGPTDLNEEGFRDRYWAAEMWSKHPFSVGIDRKAAAMATFRHAEDLCVAANSRLVDVFSRPIPEHIRAALIRARRTLQRLLSDISYDEVAARAGWGPGASTSLKRSMCSHQHKWEFATHATASVLPLVAAYFRYLNVNLMPSIEIVAGNKVTTVPKNAKTERTIAIEPDWNMFFQRGIGAAIRTRLHKVGLLHRTAQEQNKLLARIGSIDNSHATIDLKGASDSVSLALCELLLPAQLYEMVLRTRSPVGNTQQGTVTYEKVSSMGNGFTFELETALFYALSASVSTGGRSVAYGDDIITPDRSSALRVMELLEFCGFEVNWKKSFIEGPFRESCGGHYYQGADVTPPYFRKPIDSLDRYISAGNALSRRLDWRSIPDLRKFSDSWRLIAAGVPRVFRGPVSAGDVCLWAPFDSTCPEYNPSWQCFVGKGIRIDREKKAAPGWGAIQAALHGDTHTAEYATPRGVAKVCYWYADRWDYAAPNFG